MQWTQQLLDSIPKRPRRQLSLTDHLSAVTIIALSLTSGLLALSGLPWWAILPGVAALIVAHHWFAGRTRRSIYRGIRFGDTAPFPEALILGGLAPVAWLVFYLWLFICR